MVSGKLADQSCIITDRDEGLLQMGHYHEYFSHVVRTELNDQSLVQSRPSEQLQIFSSLSTNPVVLGLVHVFSDFLWAHRVCALLNFRHITHQHTETVNPLQQLCLRSTCVHKMVLTRQANRLWRREHSHSSFQQEIFHAPFPMMPQVWVWNWTIHHERKERLLYLS